MREQDRELLDRIRTLTADLRRVKIETEDEDLFDLLDEDEEDEVAGIVFELRDELERLHTDSARIVQNLGYIVEDWVMDTDDESLLHHVKRNLKDKYYEGQSELKVQILQSIETSLSTMIKVFANAFPSYRKQAMENRRAHAFVSSLQAWIQTRTIGGRI